MHLFLQVSHQLPGKAPLNHKLEELKAVQHRVEDSWDLGPHHLRSLWVCYVKQLIQII